MNKIETKSTVLLKHHLKALKLPTMHASARRSRPALLKIMPIIWRSCCNCASWN